MKTKPNENYMFINEYITEYIYKEKYSKLPITREHFICTADCLQQLTDFFFIRGNEFQLNNKACSTNLNTLFYSLLYTTLY